MTRIGAFLCLSAVVFGAGIFVNYMEGVADEDREDRLDEFYKDEFNNEDDWWNDQEV